MRTSPSLSSGTGRSVLYCRTSVPPVFSIITPFIVLGIWVADAMVGGLWEVGADEGESEYGVFGLAGLIFEQATDAIVVGKFVEKTRKVFVFVSI